MANAAQDFVDLHSDELKAPQPKFLVDWEQGPKFVDDRHGYPPDFNPQFQKRVGTVELDRYPANPVIAWHNWTYRDSSQSIKPPNVGATNITPRAALDQQTGTQLSPIQFPNQVTQSPEDWDAGVQVLPTQAPSSQYAAQRQQLLELFDGYNPAVIS